MKTLSHHLLAHSGNWNEYQLSLTVMAAYRGLVRGPETWNTSMLMAASKAVFQKHFTHSH